MKKHLLMIAALALCGAASAKLPPLSAEAKAKADEGVAKVGFAGCYFRRDIGDKGIARSGK